MYKRKQKEFILTDQAAKGRWAKMRYGLKKNEIVLQISL
jgi:hypothetical protein